MGVRVPRIVVIDGQPIEDGIQVFSPSVASTGA